MENYNLSIDRVEITNSHNDHCVCGAQENVTHVLVDCPGLMDIRRELRKKPGNAVTGVSSLLGGSTKGKKGKPDIISRLGRFRLF
jgi:hypothetical protein